MAIDYTPRYRDPYQLQKPEDAGQFSDMAMKSDVMAEAYAKPGQVIQGSQTGNTPVNGMIAPTPLMYQNIYTPSSNQPSKAISDAVGSEDSMGTLTSGPANSFVNDLGQKVSQRQLQLQQDAAASEEKLQGLDKMLSQQSSNLIQNQLKAAETAQKPIKEAFADKRGEIADARTEAEATQGVANFRGERTGTPYAESARMKREKQYALDDKRLAQEEKERLDAAWDNALRGEIGISQRLLGEAATAMQERQRIRDDMRAEQEMTVKLQEYEDNRAIKAQDRAMGTIGNIVSAGIDIKDIPTSYLEELDTQSNMPRGFSAKLFDVAKKEKEAQNIADEVAAKKVDIDNAKSIFSMLKDVPAGQSITIGENTYFGTQGTGTLEISKHDGHGRMAIVDQETGEIRVKDLGIMGSMDPAKMVPVYVNGVQMLKNADTGDIIPLVQSGGAAGDAGWDQPPPGGGKPLAQEGARGGQCGEFIHNFVSNYPYGISSIDARRSIVNVPKTETPRIGDVLLTSDGAVGHSAMVNWVGQDENGKAIIKLTESNWKGDERIMNTRTIPADGPSVLGYFRGQLRPQAESGSDLPAVYGPTRAGEEFKPIETGQTQADIDRETGIEAPKDFRVTSPSPFMRGNLTESQYAAAQEKEQSAIEAAQNLVYGTEKDIKNIPTSIRQRAISIASENGWKIKEPGTLPENRLTKVPEYRAFLEQKRVEASQSGTTFDEKAAKQEYEDQKASVQTVTQAFNAIKRSKLPKAQREEFVAQMQEAISNEDYDTIEGLLTQVGRESMVAEQQQKYDSALNLIETYSTGMDMLASFANDPSFKTGNLKKIIERAKKTGAYDADPRYTQLGQLLGVTQNEYRNALFGASLTPGEMEEANKVIIDIGSDTPSTMWEKMNQGKKIQQFVADVRIANATGMPRPKLKDYLK